MQTFRFQIDAARSPHALPRILLAFARRRLTVDSLSADAIDEYLTDVQLDCTCGEFGAQQLLAQLRRIVEVKRVTVEPVTASQHA